MNIKNHVYDAKTYLDTAQAKIESRDYDSALALLIKSWTNIRILIDHVYKLKLESPRTERVGYIYSYADRKAELTFAKSIVYVIL